MEGVSDDVADSKLLNIPSHVSVYDISGPLYFGAADLVERIMLDEKTTCLILRMGAVPSMDSTAENALLGLFRKCKKKNVTIILSHLNPQPMRAMRKAGLIDFVGPENVCKNIDAAIERSEVLAEKKAINAKKAAAKAEASEKKILK